MEVKSIKDNWRGVVAVVETDIGDLSVVFTNGGHAHVCTESGQVVTVRDREYHVSVHLFAGNEWNTKPTSEGGFASISKRVYKNYNDSHAAPTIAASIIGKCRDAVRLIIERDPDVLRRAEARDLAGALSLAEDEKRELDAKLGEVLTKIADLRTRLLEADPKGEVTPKGAMF